MALKKFFLFLFLFFFSNIIFGCGGGGGANGSDTDTGNTPASSVITGDSYGKSVSSGVRADYNVTLSDDAKVGARLLAISTVDVNGIKYKTSTCESFTELGHGQYTLNNCSSKPVYIYTFGGFMDSDDNGGLDQNESTQFASFSYYGIEDLQQSPTSYVLTPITTLVAGVDRTKTNILINKLGYDAANKASTAVLFGNNETNKLLRHMINALINSASENGIDVQLFCNELVGLINTSNSTGTNAIKDAINMIAANSSTYEAKYGKSQVESFINDTRTQSVLTGDDATILSKMLAKKVRIGRLRITGYVNTYMKGNNTVDSASIKMYIDSNSTSFASATSDVYGKYSIDVDESSIPRDLKLIFVAEKNGLKLTSSINSNALLDRRINSSINAFIMPDMIINYLTTVTAVRINNQQDGCTVKKIIFDTTVYSNKNSSNENYFIPMNILYESQLLPWGPNAEINITHITNYAKSLPNSSVPYVLDLETWTFGYYTESIASLQAKLDKYITVAKTIKAVRPDIKIGYFGLLPDVQLLESSFNPDYSYKDYVIQRMDDRYETTKSLNDYVDILFPELYTYWLENQSYAYTSRVKTGIDIYGKKYKKPIIPFLWPAYMSATGLPGGEYLSDPYWALEVSTLMQDDQVSGIAVWGGKDYTQSTHPILTWNEDSSWWQYIKQYIFP